MADDLLLQNLLPMLIFTIGITTTTETELKTTTEEVRQEITTEESHEETTNQAIQVETSYEDDQQEARTKLIIQNQHQ